MKNIILLQLLFLLCFLTHNIALAQAPLKLNSIKVLDSDTTNQYRNIARLKKINNDSLNQTTFETNPYTKSYKEFRYNQNLKQLDVLSNYFTPNRVEKYAYFNAVKKTKELKEEAETVAQKWYSKELEDALNNRSSNTKRDAIEKVYLNLINTADTTYHSALDIIYRENKFDDVRIFPAFNNYLCMLYYNTPNDRFNFFQNINLNYGGDNASFKSEIVSGFLGMFRFSLGSVLARQKVKTIDSNLLGDFSEAQLEKEINSIDSTNRANNTMIKVISGGGEVFLRAKTPLLNFRGNKIGKTALTSEIIGAISGDIPAAGSYIEGAESNVFYSIGLENSLIIPFLDFKPSREGYEAFSFNAKFNFEYIGGTKNFYKNIGINENAFLLGQYYAGISYKNVFIYYNNQFFFKESLKENNVSRIGVALTRAF